MTQLRSSLVLRDKCCCPDPDFCHCPDHQPDGPESTMQSCGKTNHVLVAPTLSPFAPPAPVATVAIAPAPAPVLPLPTAHAPPDPDRPAAPS